MVSDGGPKCDQSLDSADLSDLVVSLNWFEFVDKIYMLLAPCLPFFVFHPLFLFLPLLGVLLVRVS